ncbi:MAG: hypothetical protein Q7R49_00285 [Candidatus Daviesbacteria bacterium]|nr:hypothetical protein [Candidatus Daviesbacteria bacterium]
MWCEIVIPQKKWWTGAGVWIGVWTNKTKFMQVGIFPNAINNSLMGGTKTGTTIFWYATDEVGYYIQTINEIDIEQGDHIMLNLQKIGNSTDWILGVINMNKINKRLPNNSWIHKYVDAGNNFYITALQIIFEGYSGIYNTQFIEDGEISLNNIWLKDIKGIMTRIPAVREFNPEGGKYMDTKVFEAIPNWLTMKYDESSVTFIGKKLV